MVDESDSISVKAVDPLGSRDRIGIAGTFRAGRKCEPYEVSSLVIS
jgi:hypothetical protein